MSGLNKSGLQQGHRGLNRLRLGLPGLVHLTSEKRPCTLNDISALGAHLDVTPSLAEGRQVRLQFHDLTVFAKVVWSRGAECGLRFETPLDQEDMQGFLWIVQNPVLYERICLENAAVDWLNDNQT